MFLNKYINVLTILYLYQIKVIYSIKINKDDLILY